MPEISSENINGAGSFILKRFLPEVTVRRRTDVILNMTARGAEHARTTGVSVNYTSGVNIHNK